MDIHDVVFINYQLSYPPTLIYILFYRLYRRGINRSWSEKEAVADVISPKN